MQTVPEAKSGPPPLIILPYDAQPWILEETAKQAHVARRVCALCQRWLSPLAARVVGAGWQLRPPRLLPPPVPLPAQRQSPLREREIVCHATNILSS